MVQTLHRAPDSGRVPLAGFGRIDGAVVADGQLRLELDLDGRPLPEIRLGLDVGGADLAASVIESVRETLVDDTWTAASGKSTGELGFRHRAFEFGMRHADGLAWQLHVRLSPDGVAFRYAAEALHGVSWLGAESTRMQLPAGGRAWLLDYQTWYETPRRGVDIDEVASGDYGFPFLVRLDAASDAAPDDAPHLLITESAIDGRFSGAHAFIDDERMLRVVTADERTEVARGPLTPWRVLLIGSLAEIAGSRFVDELAPALHPDADAVAVRPGRAAWSWWSDFYSGAQLHRQRHFVDRAAEFGWEHLLIDCGWEETWVPEIVAYASRRGIQVHLWAVWHDLDGPEKLKRLALWHSWGVAGIKVDFMESESKDRYRWYDSVLLESARLGLMVNFHGSVIPRGWSRTWPQVVGYEAIRGSEYYVFYQDTPLDAAHNVIQPFTRNVVGAMDYTPVALTAPGRTTSDGHELGMAVAFECGITHFADDVDVYASRPEVARALSELPARWDETVLLAGTPDTEAVVARRFGDRWFVGAIATGAARTLTVPLDRLGGGAWQAWVVTDAAGTDAAGTDAAGHGLAEGTARAERVLRVDIATDGGFFAVLAPEGTPLFRARPRPVLDAPLVRPERASLDASGAALIETDPDAVLRLPAGWRAEARASGTWRVTAPHDLRPGALGVVTVELPGDDGAPLLAHARLVAPLTPGEHRLSALPMLAFTNESGPVERDMSNGGGNPADGIPMVVGGTACADGFGVSTPSEFTIALDGAAHRLTVEVGVDDETPAGSATAEVIGDGAVLATLEVRGGRPVAALDLDVSGIRTLGFRTLPTAPGDDPAHVDWANGRLRVAPTDLHTTPDPDHR